MGVQDSDDDPRHVLRLGRAAVVDAWQALPYRRKSGARVLGVTSERAEHWLSRWDHVRPHPAQLGVVSTTDQTRAASTDRAIDPSTVGLTVETVDGSADLTGLGFVVDDYASAWQAGNGNPIVWFHDLGPLLAAADERDVFRLLHVVRGRLDDVGGRLYAEVDPSDASTEAMATLETAFDRVERAD